MKIEYVRNMQSGYMRILQQIPLEKLEMQMLSQNELEGILPVRWQQENDQYILSYDITGKQALDTVLETDMADDKLLKSLLTGIYVAIRQLEKHLLTQEGLLLRPETIYWDYKMQTMHFCYCPDETRNLQEQFLKLMEYMLVKTDHQNLFAVQLAYGIYEEAQKPSFYIKDLKTYLAERTYQEEVIAEKDEVEKETAKEITKETAVAQEEEMSAVKPERKLPDFCKKLLKIQLLEWKKERMGWIKEEIEKRIRRKKSGQSVIYETQEEMEKNGEPTVILEIKETAVKGILKYEGTHALADMVIEKVPFLIGSADNCDGMIRRSNISHYHAKITYQEGTYFLEDLNSTNGTMADGGMLSYKTRVSLQKNESIYFADEPYRFL